MTHIPLANAVTADLLEEFGSPLFVVNESVLRQTFRDFSRTFSTPEFPSHVAFSYKTNYLPAVCAILRNEGAWAEVVSGPEYRLARRLGHSPGEIVFNGPWKTRDELETALAEGACIVLDGLDEFSTVESLVGGFKQPARLGIRIAFNGGKTDWSRFGFAHGDATHILERIAKNPALDLHMLHSHCGTNVGDPGVYSGAAAGLVELAKLAAALHLAPAFIDLGGGFPSGVNLTPYARAITKTLRPLAHLFDTTPALLLEPGRSLVSLAMQLVCTVVAVKDIPGRGRAIILNGGRNLLPPACREGPGTLSVIRVKDVDQPPQSSYAPVAVFGPLCMPEDIINESALLPPLAPGDLVLVHEAGAYTITQSMPFIRPCPGVVLLGPDGPVLIRRAQTDEDLFACDVLPPHLKQS